MFEFLLFAQLITYSPIVTKPVAIVDPLPTVASSPADGESVLIHSEPSAVQPPVCPNCGDRHWPSIVNNTKDEGSALAPPTYDGGPALREANQVRAGMGLPPFKYDHRLQASVDRSVELQVARGWGHKGQPMPHASGEGVGSGPQFTACYLKGTHQYAAAATGTRPNGQRVHALQVSGPGNGNNGGRIFGGGGRLFGRWRR